MNLRFLPSLRIAGATGIGRQDRRNSIGALVFILCVVFHIAVLAADGQIGKQGGAFPGTTVSISATMDTSILENNPGNNMGGHPFVEAGRTDITAGFAARRGLFWFDIAANIPPGSMVTDASITVNVGAVSPGFMPSLFDFFPVDLPWIEGGGIGDNGVPAIAGEATWISAQEGALSWMSPGGDFAPSPSASALIMGMGPVVFFGDPMFGLRAQIQDLVDGVNPNNFGFLLKSADEIPGVAAQFISREGSPAATLSVTFLPPPTLTLNITQSSISENGGTANATISTDRADGDTGAVTVSFSAAQNGDEVMLPTTVTIPMGQNSQSFSIPAVDDLLLDGTQTVSITATAVGAVSAADSVDVTDYETVTVTLAGSSAAENAGSLAGSTVTRSNTDVDNALTVTLNSSDTSEATVPMTVTIPAMAASVGFDITLVDDVALDGDQLTTITASATGYVSSQDDINVTDYELDFGDAPSPPYPTVLVSAGARHLITGLRLGLNIDNELDGIPDPLALGDDLTQGPIPAGAQPQTPGVMDDEDGVTLPIIYLGAGPVSATIHFDAQDLPIGGGGPAGLAKQGESASLIGFLNAWIDYNKDGDWNDVGEQIAMDFGVVSGDNSLMIAAPSLTPGVIEPGPTYARFRLSATGGLLPTGSAESGEVEDYLIQMHGRPNVSYSGAPFTFAAQEDVGTITPGNSGAPATSWMISPSLPAGLSFSMTTGEITGAASGVAAQNDYAITASNPAGVSVTMVSITVNGPRLLVSINESSISENGGTSAGVVTLPDMPAVGNLTINLASSDTGEVMDPVSVMMLDGESSASFSITAVDDMLLDGTQTVTITASLQSGNAYSPGSDTIDVTDHETLTISAPGANAFFENAGPTAISLQVTRSNTDNSSPLVVTLSSDDTNEATVPPTVTIPAGQASATFSVGAMDDDIIELARGAMIAGAAAGYAMGVSYPVVVLDYELDFGDAPDLGRGTGPGDYQTLSSDMGAAHVIGGHRLGELVDNENDGQPSKDADGDDIAGGGGALSFPGPAGPGALDDEDGVTFGTMIAGQTTTITVDVQTQSPTLPASVGKQGVSGPFLDAWIDWNQDGVWDNATEKIASSLAVIANQETMLMVTVPADAALGDTYARFRLSQQGGLDPTDLAGPALYGEVEDYIVQVAPQPTEVSFDPGTGALSITDVASGGKVDALTLSSDMGAVVLTDPINGFQIGSDPLGVIMLQNGGFEARVSVPVISSVLIDLAGKDDSLLVGLDLTGQPDSVPGCTLAIDMGAGEDALNFAGGPVVLLSRTLTTANTETIGVNQPISGTGDITLTAGRSISVSGPGAVQTTGGGNITLAANQGMTPASGSFNGVELGLGVISTVDGNVEIRGRGGDTGPNQRGVHISGMSMIASSGSGMIIIDGTGDASGVTVAGAGAGVASASGSITLTGASGSGEGLDVGLSTSVSSSGGGNIFLNAERVTLDGSVSSTGLLFIRPLSSSTSIGLGGGAGEFNLTDGELAGLADGFDSITIGPPGAGTGMVTMDTVTFTDGVFINGGVFVDGAGVDLTAPAALLRGQLSPGGAGAAGVLELNANLHVEPPGSVLNIEIGGTGAETGHDQLNVTGTLTLFAGIQMDSPTALNLSALNSFTPLVGQSFTIVDNDSSDAIAGVFDGLPEGATISNFLGSGLVAVITYQGGDGNDVVLTIGEPPAIDYTQATYTFYVDEPISPAVAPTLSGGATDSYSVQGTLPSGVMFNASNGELSGTPTAFNGHTTYTVTGGNAFGSAMDTFAIQVFDRRTEIGFNIVTGEVTVTDVSTTGKADSLVVSVQGGDLVFADPAAKFIVAAGPGAASITLIGDDEARLPLALVQSLSIQLQGGDDSLDFSMALLALDTIGGGGARGWNRVSTAGLISERAVSIEMGAGDDTLRFIGGDSFLDGRSLTAMNGETVVIGNEINTSGDVMIDSNRLIAFNTPGRITAEGLGNVTLNANQGAVPATGNFIGIAVVQGARITALNGSIILRGRGGDGGSGNVGVKIAESANVMASSGGLVTIEGTGGSGIDLNHGVQLDASATVDMTGGGTITITGTAASSGRGISITSGAGISGDAAAGSGAVLTGTGTGGEADIFFESLTADANIHFDGAVEGSSFSTLAGSYAVEFGNGGTILDPVSFLNSGDVKVEGVSPAILNLGGLSLNAGNQVRLGVFGPGAGTGHDQLNVTGSVDLGGSLLGVGSLESLAAGEEYRIVNNDGTDAIVGTFAGLPEGAALSETTALRVTITYAGGSGNDVVLAASLPRPPTISYAESSYGFATGQALSPTVNPVLGGGPVASISVSPPLPSGLSLNAQTGVISGTPDSATAAGVYIVTAMNAGGGGAAMLTISVATQAALPADGLVLHWTLDDVSGPNTLESVSGSSSVASVIGPVTSAPRMAPDNGAAALFGVDNMNRSYIDAGTLTAGGSYQTEDSHSARRLTRNWSMTAWINLSSSAPGGDNVIASSDTQGSDWWLFMANNGNLTFDFNSSRVGSGLSIPRDQPVFVALMADSSGTGFDQAGNKHRFAVFDGTTWSFAEGAVFDEIRLLGLEIGSFNDGTRQFDGALDDVRIYDKALTQSDLDELVYSTLLSADGSGKLIVTDLVDDGKADDLTVWSDTANARFVVSDPDSVLQSTVPNSTRVDAHTIYLPFSEIFGSQLRFELGGGDDSLTVNLDLGVFAPDIVYDGGDGNTTVGDSLTVRGGDPVALIKSHYVNEQSGLIEVSGTSKIYYSDLEPITLAIDAAEVQLLYGAASETITVSADPEMGGTLAVSTAGERTSFRNPTGLLVVDGGAGTDVINMRGFGPGFSAGLLIPSAGDALHFEIMAPAALGAVACGVGSVNVTEPIFAAAGSIDLRAETDVIVSASLSTMGASITLTSDTDQASSPGGGIVVNNGAAIATMGGDIVLGGGADPNLFPAVATMTSEDGVHIDGATLDAGGGNILIRGYASVGPGADDGVELQNGALLVTTTGEIAIFGDSAVDDGIDLDPGSRIQTGSGAVTLTGGSSGNSGEADGVTMDGQDTQVRTDSGPITINGATSGTGNDAVHIFVGAEVMSQNGDIQIDGMATGDGDAVDIEDGGRVISTGEGKITITGMAGAASESGIEVQGTETLVSSSHGNIQLTGTGGTGDGVNIDSGARVESIGPATISIDGTSLATGNEGVDISDVGTLVTSISGAIGITGSNDNNDGVYVAHGGVVSSTGTGANAATITIMGTSAAADNEGVDIGDAGVMVTSIDGDISITGVNTGGNDGVYISSGGVVSSTGTGPTAAKITIHGTATASGNDGADIDRAGTLVTSVDGDIAITGLNHSTGDGIEMDSGSVVSSTGAGNVTLQGDTADPTSEALDIGSGAAGAQIRSNTGDISISGGNPGGVGLFSYSTGLIASSGGGNIVLAMDDVVLDCPVMSTGNLTIKPLRAATSIGLGGGAGTLNLDDAELTNLSGNFVSIQIGDAMNGAGAVNIDSATFLAPVTISGGVINDGAGSVDIAAPSVTLDGNVSPGMSPGVLTVLGDYAFSGDAMLTLELGGLNAGEGMGFRDQIAVTGSVNLANARLAASFTGGFMATVGQEFPIVVNDGSDAVAGTFFGLPNDGLILITGQLAKVSYVGGDGNDVTLTVIANNLPPFNHVIVFAPDLNGDVQGLFQGLSGVEYQLWGASDLPNWTLLQSVTANQDGIVSFLDAAAGAMPRRFYQIRQDGGSG